MTPRLSKSRIQSGRQCQKRLWLELNQPETARWGGAAQTRLDEGTRFGELARDLLGGGLLITADHLHVREALAETQAALERPHTEFPMLFEPAFSHEDVRVRVDAFQRGEDGDTLIEVKSTTSVKGEHIWDCAVQTWVARGAGRHVRKVMLAHVDNQFVYTTAGDYTGLLTQVDITEAVEALQPEIPVIVATLKKVAIEPMPGISTGRHCSTPYGCPFLSHCQSGEAAPAQYPVDLLPRAGALIERLQEAGYRDLRDVPDSELPNGLLKRIAAATRTEQTYVSEEFRRILVAIPYPRFFLDFETISFVIPRWLGTRPFQSLPFQFSCHSEAASGAISHTGFLDLSGESPLATFIDHLLEAVAEEGPIIVWNKGFEASRLRDLAGMFPDRSEALLRVIERMVDLLPLYREHYYHRDMRGSWSIKAVLPTLAPELAYADLTIGDGSEAQSAYMEAIRSETPAHRRDALREQLLAYCERDTRAMVRLMTLEESGATVTRSSSPDR
ncbi:MAG: DUF2779 domain-containing protein [Dokdonella sp.]|uniref:DUF2779 domain-containing protein n=1 Tax=Dokdonella sp. TaxID=2291710 RepID=UPI0025B8345B|nr:DUF2779 domain-containing protein [Dokdonella sp.]MBZ0223882.1 DUF2779 domain-containing protein [Dokdonella sp.]